VSYYRQAPAATRALEHYRTAYHLQATPEGRRGPQVDLSLCAFGRIRACVFE
jgi:hypothetical protein